MAWRSWSVVAMVILANYIVFSLLATVVFPPTPVTAPTRVAKPTFTPGVIDLKNVGAFSYSFLTPTATAAPAETIPATGPAQVPATTAPSPRP